MSPDDRKPRNGAPRTRQAPQARRTPARRAAAPQPRRRPSVAHQPKPARPPKPPKAPREPGERGRRTPILLAITAVVLLAPAGVLVMALSGGGDGERQAPAADPAGRAAESGLAPASYSSSPSTEAYEKIGERSADSRPLTAAEAFPPSSAVIEVPEAKARLGLRAKRLDTGCAKAVWGAALAADLRRGGCTQAARTLYSDGKKGFALAVTVLNLESVRDADRIVEGLDRGRGGGFVVPLPAAAPLDRFGQGFGMGRGLAVGHYVVVAWAQRLDGKGDERDEALLSVLIEGGKAQGPLRRAAHAS